MQRVSEGQLSAVIGAAPSAALVQAPAPPPGSPEVSTPPETSPATQSGVTVQVTDSSATPEPAEASTWVTAHPLGGPVGSVVVSTSPFRSVPTQRAEDGHDREVTGSVASMCPETHDPAAGLPDAKTVPESSPATHRLVCGHDREMSGLCPSMFTPVHADGPPAGRVVVWTSPCSSPATQKCVFTTQEIEAPTHETSVGVQMGVAEPGSDEVSTSPCWSTATQRLVDGQDTPSKLTAPSTSVTLHAGAPPSGLVEVSTSPLKVTATHSVAEGQDRPETWLPTPKRGTGMTPRTDQVRPAAAAGVAVVTAITPTAASAAAIARIT